MLREGPLSMFVNITWPITTAPSSAPKNLPTKKPYAHPRLITHPFDKILKISPNSSNFPLAPESFTF